MLEVGRDLDLAEETLRTDGRREFRAEDFDRDLAVMLQVPGEIDRRHPTSTDSPLDGVAVGEGGGEAVDVGHGAETDRLPGFGEASTSRLYTPHRACPLLSVGLRYPA